MHCVSEELRLKLTDRIFELTESKVRELGYELYDVEYQKEYDNWVLTLYIDSDGSACFAGQLDLTCVIKCA